MGNLQPIQEAKMHERSKLREARYFYQQMEQTHDDRQAFRHNLSAFLSSARSILQYAEKEVDGTSSKAWYDTKIAESDVLQFFRDKRDLNIHEEPVEPKKHTHIQVRERVQVSDGVSLTVRDREGNIVDEYSDSPQEDAIDEPESDVSVDEEWIFDDWPGDEDILTLCQAYTDELDRFVEEGTREGHISG